MRKMAMYTQQRWVYTVLPQLYNKYMSEQLQRPASKIGYGV